MFLDEINGDPSRNRDRFDMESREGDLTWTRNGQICEEKIDRILNWKRDLDLRHGKETGKFDKEK